MSHFQSDELTPPRKRLRVIAPAPNSASSSHRPAPCSSSDSLEGLQKKRPNIQLACDECRARKSACDGQKPICSPCIKRGKDCVYDMARSAKGRIKYLEEQLAQVQSELKKQNELVAQLKPSVPDPEATKVLQHLDPPKDTGTLLAMAETSNMYSMYRPSNNATTRALLPPTRFEFETELHSRHQKAYPILVPIDITSIDLDSLFVRPQQLLSQEASRCLEHFQQDTNDNDSPPQQEEEATGMTQLMEPPPPPLRGTPVRRSSPVEGPFPKRSYVDDRLQRLDLEYWTCVPISNEFAASVISLYLEVDHPILGLFDADLFLEDVVDHRLRFASPFLVCALLSFACQTYTAIDVTAAALAQAFLLEAESLWKAERFTDSLTTVAALSLFSLACATQGKAGLGMTLVEQAHRMAERMRLFESPHEEATLNTLNATSPDFIKAASHTAWGTYNWLTYHALFYEDRAIGNPPLYPMPGLFSGTSDISRDSGWPTHPLPHYYMGSVFFPLCQLWSIAQEVVGVYIPNKGRGTSKRASLAFAESKYQKLLKWLDMLPPEMQRTGHEEDHVILLHIFFHFIIIYIFRPFMATSSQAKLGSFSSKDSSPESVFHASVNQLKRILLHRRLHQPTERIYCSMYSLAILTISNAVINEGDPTSRFYFLLCTRYFEELYVRYPVYKLILEGILALAIDSAAISTTEAMTISTELRVNASHHEMKGETAGSFTIDFKSALEDRQTASAQILAQKFIELTIFEQFVQEEPIRRD